MSVMFFADPNRTIGYGLWMPIGLSLELLERMGSLDGNSRFPWKLIKFH